MLEIMNWIAQDVLHFFGTLLFIIIVSYCIAGIIHGDK